MAMVPTIFRQLNLRFLNGFSCLFAAIVGHQEISQSQPCFRLLRRQFDRPAEFRFGLLVFPGGGQQLAVIQMIAGVGGIFGNQLFQPRQRQIGPCR